MSLTSFRSAARHYVFGLLASSWNGGISAVAGILGIDAVAMSGADQLVSSGQQARILNAHEMLAAFVGAFVLHAILWLKSHPIPETFGTNPPIPPS